MHALLIFRLIADDLEDHDSQATISALFQGKIFSRRYIEIFFLTFPKETDFDSSCKFAWHAKSCLLGKNKKSIFNLSSAGLANSVVKVRGCV